MTAKEHNNLLSIFYFVMAGLQLVGGVLVFFIYVVMGGLMMSTSSRNNEQMMGGIFLVMGIILAVVMLVLAGITLFAGLKVKKIQPIGRTLGIIISIISLFSFPLGTALGIYGLWFFFGDLGKNLYSGIGQGSYTPPPPPAPGTWQ